MPLVVENISEVNTVAFLVFELSPAFPKALKAWRPVNWLSSASAALLPSGQGLLLRPARPSPGVYAMRPGLGQPPSNWPCREVSIPQARTKPAVLDLVDHGDPGDGTMGTISEASDQGLCHFHPPGSLHVTQMENREGLPPLRSKQLPSYCCKWHLRCVKLQVINGDEIIQTGK